jgi:hypothetical protein
LDKFKKQPVQVYYVKISLNRLPCLLFLYILNKSGQVGQVGQVVSVDKNKKTVIRIKKKERRKPVQTCPTCPTPYREVASVC